MLSKKYQIQLSMHDIDLLTEQFVLQLFNDVFVSGFCLNFEIICLQYYIHSYSIFVNVSLSVRFLELRFYGLRYLRFVFE